MSTALHTSHTHNDQVGPSHSSSLLLRQTYLLHVGISAQNVCIWEQYVKLYRLLGQIARLHFHRIPHSAAQTVCASPQFCAQASVHTRNGRTKKDGHHVSDRFWALASPHRGSGVHTRTGRTPSIVLQIGSGPRPHPTRVDTRKGFVIIISDRFWAQASPDPGSHQKRFHHNYFRSVLGPGLTRPGFTPEKNGRHPSCFISILGP